MEMSFYVGNERMITESFREREREESVDGATSTNNFLMQIWSVCRSLCTDCSDGIDEFISKSFFIF